MATGPSDPETDRALAIKAPVGWKVRTGHRQPGPRQDIDAALNRSGVVRTGASLGVAQPPRQPPSSPAEPSASSVRSSCRFEDNGGEVQLGRTLGSALYTSDAAGLLGGGVFCVPTSLVISPAQYLAGLGEAGPSTSQEVTGGTSHSCEQSVGRRGATSSWPPHAALMPVDEDKKLREEELRRSKRLRDQSVKRNQELRQRAPVQNVQRVESRRLKLECTFNQGNENEFCSRLDEFWRVSSMSASGGLPRRAWHVYEAAKAANCVRMGRRGDYDDYDRLTHLIQGVHISRVTDVRNCEWNFQLDVPSSPLAALTAADHCLRGGPAPPRIWLSTIRTEVDLHVFLAICQSYRGPPCTITTDEVCPAGCEQVSNLFWQLNRLRASLVHQLETVRGPERAEVEAQFAAMRNDYGMLYCLVCWANARLIGPLDSAWRPPLELKPEMYRIVRELGVTREQRWQLLEMRERGKKIVNDTKVAQLFGEDMAELWEQTFQSPELFGNNQMTRAYFDSVEAAEEAKYILPATECMVSQAALSNILNPLQSAHMVVYGYLLYMGMVGKYYEAVNFWRFMAACFMDENLGEWLDDAQPPSPTMQHSRLHNAQVPV